MTLRRKTYPGNAPLTELAGDMDKAFAALVPLRLVEFTEVYDEPMAVAIAPVPKAVIALDVREDDAPEGSVIGASRIDFTRTETGVRINEIDGASVGTKYRFLLLAVGG